MNEKFLALKEYIKSLESVIVAFSGGVDSTFLLRVSHDVLKNNALAVTVNSDLVTPRELEESKNFCAKNNIEQIIINVNELEIPGFKENNSNRCYLCKKNIFTTIIKIAQERKISNIFEGSNFDDLKDYRPGLKAVKELGIKSPLREFKFTKSEIRELSRSLGLETWDKSSFACLASRFAYGEIITLEKLKMIRDSEKLLFDLGFKQFRVRIHEKIARIEVNPNDFVKIIDNREKIYYTLQNLGFKYITLDLLGYRTGSMNEEILK